MTCSSSTIFTLDRHWRGWRIAAILAIAAGLAAPGQADSAGSVRELVARAEQDLARGDGIAAEIRLKQALGRGASREEVAALMGEALVDQGQPARAREWLGPARFSARTAARGWRNLGRLERAERNLQAASRAYDAALRAAPKDAGIWVEVGYLRFALGDHADGIDAVARALELDPGNPRVLEAKGSLVRDQYGLAAALPWLEAGLKAAPDDIALLGGYAATLGELDRATEMLEVTRRMLAIDGKNAQAYYLQAVLAARAGNITLARTLLAKGGKGLAEVPGALLLSAALDLGSGNPQAAVATLEALLERQPGNLRARELHAAALLAAGNAAQVIARHAAATDGPAASPYLLTVVARAFEARGDRARAAPLLDRAMRDWSRPIAPVRGNPLGALLASGQAGAAQARAATAANPANAAAAGQAGDVALAQGRATDAAEAYARAAQVRLSDSLLLKYSVALEVAGRGPEAARLVDAALAQTPTSGAALWLAAAVARRERDWKRAALLLAALRDRGGAGDVNLAMALADAQARAGDTEAALATARAAWRLQRGSGFAAAGYGAALTAAGQGARAKPQLAKAAAMGADLRALPPVRYAFPAPR